MIRARLVTTSLILISICGCRGLGREGSQESGRALLFDGMGGHRRTITTGSPTAQRYFDQGLTWTYAFNHDEAIRSFIEAARQDPNCAMAYWGISLCHGPHINNPEMTPESSAAAWEALQKAIARRDSASDVERDLIDALSHRYADPAPADRMPLNESYANAMRAVWKKYPNDADVGTLFAESLMGLRPWDLWKPNGEPQPGTEEIVATLEEVLRLQPTNPGANHLYIHTVEASPNPGRATVAADRLADDVPASGHLLHMPSHIYVLTGRWADASHQNELAIRADRKYRRQVPRQGFYRVYMAHNTHMLAFACMMEGRSKDALRAAREMIAAVPADYARENAALVDPMFSAPYDVLKRFGRWDDILREAPPPEYLPYTTAIWRGHRALAYAARGDVVEAEREQAAFKQAVAAVPPEARAMINPARDILAIADRVVAGEIALAKKDTNQAVAELKQAVELETQLMYMEPPEWVQPVRHTLGAVLVSDGRYAEAEQVYRDDLRKWPGNGWSLYGLERALRGQGKLAEADQADKEFRKAWSRADTRIGSSCLCVK